MPVPHRAKRPIHQGWQRLQIKIDAVPQYFNGKQQNHWNPFGDKHGSADVASPAKLVRFEEGFEGEPANVDADVLVPAVRVRKS